MTSYCSECGAELIEGSKFCTSCGKDVIQQPETPIQPEPEQPVENKQISKPPKTKKKLKKKFIMGLLAIIVVAVIVVVIAVYLRGGTESSSVVDSRFVGEWQEQKTFGSWTFNSNGTFGINSSSDIKDGTWGVSGNQLCFNNNSVCYTYMFSDNGNILTLNQTGLNNNYPATAVLTKGGLQGTTQTPDIQCSSDSATNRIIIESVDANVRWSDIEISTNNANATWQVQNSANKGLARIGTTATISVYMSVGDSILLLETTGGVTVTLTFKPTNAILGNWMVNV
jgi:hypothetical protein